MNNNEQIEYSHESLLKVSDLMRILNISRTLAYSIVRGGELPVVKINSAIRIRKQDLDEYIRGAWTGQRE